MIRIKPLAAILYLCCFLVLLNGIQVFSQEQNTFDAKDLSVEWQLIKNHHPENNQFVATLTFKNNSFQTLPPKGWKILFNLRYHGNTLTSQTPSFKIKHISGELFSIQPTGDLKPILPGQSVVLEYKGSRIVANYQDVPTGLIWVSEGQPNIGVDLEKIIINETSDSKHERLPQPDATVLFNQNKLTEDIPMRQLPKVFPTPATYKELPGTFLLDESVQIIADNVFLQEAEHLSNELEKLFKKKIGVNTLKKGKTIFLKSSRLPAEAYNLKIHSDRVIIEAGDEAGAFYGIQSLKSLFPPDAWNGGHQSIAVQSVEISDAPRFPFRAFMLDVARNFQPKEEVLKVLELMSLYKLNVFHFHLNDDEGWRLEISGLPELTEVGATRGYPYEDNRQLHPSYGSGVNGRNSAGSGYYTRADYIEILKYATTRHIRVVPEIEAPGHARAAIKSMQYRHDKYLNAGNIEEANRYLLQDPKDASTYLSNQYFTDNVMDVTLPSTYTFIEKVVDELQRIYQEAGAQFEAIHMAGDEVPHGSWERSPARIAFGKSHPAVNSSKALWKYYFDQIKRMLKNKGLAIYGWQELVVGTQTEGDMKHVINPDFLKDDVQLDAWWNLYGNEDIPYKLANTGYKTVLTCFDYFYFDLAYRDSFHEPGDGWIGFLDIDKIYSFIPLDYYRNAKTDVRGQPLPAGFFNEKERLTEKGKQHITGVQGALWGENLISPEIMEYLLMPKLMALAEGAWAPEPGWAMETAPNDTATLYKKSWSIFVNTIGKRELPKLDFYNGGFGYRIPTPGAVVDQGKVLANIQIPGFAIHYTLDGTEPTLQSKKYNGPIADKGTVKLSAFDTRGRKGKTISISNL